MVPGPDQIIACPHCKGLAKYRTWLSGTIFGAVCWTDGKQMDVGIVGPCHPAVVKCRHCSGCYWLADADEIGTVGPWGKKGPQGNSAWKAAQEVQEPAEEEYYLALEKNLARDRHQERRLRVLAWWRRNDALRDRSEQVPLPQRRGGKTSKRSPGFWTRMTRAIAS
jgi:hypothetical protein